MDVHPFSEAYLGATLDFAQRARPAFAFSWADDEALFRWKYAHPLHRLPGQELPAWIVREGERVVGFLGSMPVEFWHGGRTLPGNVAMDLFLEESCRGRGAVGELLRLYEASAPLSLMLVSSERAHAIYLRRGYRNLPGLCSRFHAWSARDAARWLLRRLKLARFAPGPPAPADALREWLAAQPGVAVLAPGETGAADDLLRRHQRAHATAPRRTVASLIWRHREHPARHGEIFTLRDQGVLKAVFALCNRRLAGPPMLVLADLFLAEPDDEATVRRVVDLCRRLLGPAGAHALNTVGPPCLAARVLAESALIARARPLRCSLRVEGGDAGVDPARCYVSAGDGDYIR